MSLTITLAVPHAHSTCIFCCFCLFFIYACTYLCCYRSSVNKDLYTGVCLLSVFFLSCCPLPRKEYEVMRSVCLQVFCLYLCLSVCLSVCLRRSHISKTTHPNFTTFSAHINSVAVGEDSAISYVLPVLWMTSRIHAMGRMARDLGNICRYTGVTLQPFSIVQSHSPGGARI